MIRKPTIILLIFLALGIGFAWYWEKSPAKEARQTPTPTSKPAVLSSWTEADVTGIDLADSVNKLQVSVRLGANGWAVEGRTDLKLTEGAIENGIAQLLSSYPLSQVNPTTADSVLGLDKPAKTITLLGNDNKKVLIRIGNQAPTGSGYFVRFDDQPAIVLSATPIENLFADVKPQELTPAAPAATLAPSPSPTANKTVTPIVIQLTPSAATPKP